ncbi:nucleoside-diphosphate sugar epimerase/dehydratase [Flavitalea sp. BT771]|uniref:polysaccharide biosynthesis protein n=1 Tax=Flavitalea sp. BT771 TaxID=3063329 RepID=UPI0026E4967D|nr:nucleoside-diphosphate sugar epimerase/dehydratase [Flavitalea sp. BT771]MDO6429400.1 nucleoside-diphosphate sugar epimerase/dehydratase [Flavitalea sp. BT771]MDV6218472.1 nucleoside-diphosphate sugar epimerase/dehydratase [Flavitalea sp. BT771]
MRTKLLRTIAPRWIIFSIEQMLIFLSFVLSVFTIKHLQLNIHLLLSFKGALMVNMTMSCGFAFYFKTYCGIIRYSEIKDILRVIVFALSHLTAWVVLLLIWANMRFFKVISPAFLFVNLSVMCTHLIGFRLLVKEVYRNGEREAGKANRNVIIYGADTLAIAAKKAIEIDSANPLKVVAFLDDDADMIYKTLDRVVIFPCDSRALDKLLGEKKVQELIIARPDLRPEKKLMLSEICGSRSVKITTLPPLELWKNGGFRVNQLRELTIESLLEREEISFQNEKTDLCFSNSVVLVSGAAGSIGSELCRQLCRYYIQRIILLDQSESGLHDLEFELHNSNERVDLCIELASVRDRKRMEEIVARYKPDYLFHAAAYKHVPIMEYFPAEAVLTNVMGTFNLADISVRYNVRKFVMISTDKAVNPTNIMGATKRIAEMYIQSLSEQQHATQFITTRFGNVLGSNGSVVPLFKKQILKGGPVTITHPDITRYFMTIPEASRLVLEACVMGNGGEIFVFDMGNPIRILDLAKKMIELSGFIPDKEIAIEFTNLRPGEKMHEELFKESEQLIPTYHPKIMLAKRCLVDYEIFKAQLDILMESVLQQQGGNIRQLIRSILPEYEEQTL